MTRRPPDRTLRVDLSAGTVESEAVPAEWRRRFLGGKGLAARYLFEELSPGTDPLSPENVLLFALGPLSGVAPGEQRFAAVTKSPLTGAFLDSYAGGSFPGRLAGALGRHVALLIEGCAPEPTVLRVTDGRRDDDHSDDDHTGDDHSRDGRGAGCTATIEPTDLWGATIPETDAALEGAVAAVGPAGERRVRFSTVGTDGGDHQAGRGGVGAVMGAKRLKAVVADADPPAENDEAAARRVAAERRFSRTDAGRWLAAGGTVETLDFADEVGVLPTRGWQEGTFEGADGIGVEAARRAADRKEGETDPDGSAADGPGTGDFRVADDRGETVVRGGAPMTLGAGLGIGEFDAVADLGGLCDRLGLDVISAGNAVAWAVRAGEAGRVDCDLSFGDAAGARSLLSAVARRETGLPDALADGVAAAARRFGGEDLVPTVKAMALPSYDPRGSPAMALAYATSDRGACHRRARPVVDEAFAPGGWSRERRARAVAAEQDVRSLYWSLVVDDFVGGVAPDLGASWLAAVGLSYDPGELRRLGERVWTLTRLFNVREGFDRADDALPAALREPLVGGPNDGRTIDPADFERTLDAYYDVRGWDDRGRPGADLCDRLDLADLREDALG
ncbi:MAG: aldehyde ferredoxin oxidoreductase family protein [Salinigranum sp.]